MKNKRLCQRCQCAVPRDWIGNGFCRVAVSYSDGSRRETFTCGAENEAKLDLIMPGEGI